MPIPGTPNTTCDIYRAGRTPPANPNIQSVPCTLVGIYPQGLERSEGDSDSLKYTHKLFVHASVDIRDDYSLGVIGGGQDTVYIADKTGTAYTVIFVEFVDLGMPWQHKRVYLARKAVNWPVASANEL